jgi:glycosyltransferase involved in cell wall biosynthesis
MNPAIHRPSSRVWFCYARPPGFSGQKEATELIMRGLAARGWDCRALPQPVLDRDQGGPWALVRFAAGLLAAWTRALRLLLGGDAHLCVNLGLTPVAFVRDAVPLLLGRLALGRGRIILSLHGSLFLGWAPGSPRARAFVFLLRQGGLTTVLGEGQRRKLAALGLPAERSTVVINSCALPPLTDAGLRAKWAEVVDNHRPLRVLHLGSLIATKGFPEYLEALGQLADRDGRPVEAVLCGKVAASEFQDRFPDNAAAGRWIEDMVARLNRSARVKVRWVRGAVGDEKAALFRAADVFVLPTRYAVEAQPLVLLEAMASGCAIVTTRIGEIPAILDDASAIFLGAGSAAELAAVLEERAQRPDTLETYARAAHRRFVEQFSLDRHLDGWEARLAPDRGADFPRVEAARSET